MLAYSVRTKAEVTCRDYIDGVAAENYFPVFSSANNPFEFTQVHATHIHVCVCVINIYIYIYIHIYIYIYIYAKTEK